MCWEILGFQAGVKSSYGYNQITYSVVLSRCDQILLFEPHKNFRYKQDPSWTLKNFGCKNINDWIKQHLHQTVDEDNVFYKLWVNVKNIFLEGFLRTLDLIDILKNFGRTEHLSETLNVNDIFKETLDLNNIFKTLWMWTTSFRNFRCKLYFRHLQKNFGFEQHSSRKLDVNNIFKKLWM